MKWQQLLVDLYRRLSGELEHVLAGLTIEEFHHRPAGDANPIGWLCWHATRGLDRTIGDVFQGEQLWIRDGWYARFGRKPDPNDTGYGHSFKEAGDFTAPDIETLLEYHRAVIDASIRYLESLSEQDLDREFPLSAHPGKTITIGARIVGNLNDCLQHVGQAAYVRGLLKGQGWLGR